MHGRHLVGLLLAGLLVVACKDVAPHPSPGFKATRIVVERVDQETFLVRGKMRRRLAKLDPDRVVRLTRLVFPDTQAVKLDRGAVVDCRTPREATAFMDATLWVDALIVARRGLSLELGTPAATDASVVAETIRRYLHVDPPVDPPDWSAVSKALDGEAIWVQSPQTAGVGAVFLAGVLLQGTPDKWSRKRAGKLYSRVVVEPEMPSWLSVVAYANWNRKDFLASDESP
ncbi:MAG: hypothetical protein ACYTDY_14625 [Planctomycetota bacterium]